MKWELLRTSLKATSEPLAQELVALLLAALWVMLRVAGVLNHEVDVNRVFVIRLFGHEVVFVRKEPEEHPTPQGSEKTEVPAESGTQSEGNLTS